MELSEKYPKLANLMGAYFNQDWHLFYLWDIEPDYPPVVRFYKVHNPQSSLTQLIKELKEFLSKGYDESALEDAMDDLVMELNLPHWKLTYQEWLEDVLRILEEPMEVTKKQYIPYKA
jgi:CdiI immunity protein